jgi:hypothetical protein
VMMKNVSATQENAELMDCADAEEDGNLWNISAKADAVSIEIIKLV